MWFFLNLWTYVNAEKKEKLLKASKDIEVLFSCRTKDLSKLNADFNVYETAQHEELCSEGRLEERWEEMEEKGIRYVSREDPDFPPKLLDVSPLIPGLFVKGSLPDPNRPAVSLIGARRCSVYGKETGYFLGKSLGEHGVQVISGMALGVDGFSMRGGAASGTPTFGVLGSGPDICYPRENIDLYKTLCDAPEKHGILSERPPGHKASLPQDFPLRNRIISGLCDVLAVIESSLKSGTLITVEYALKQNKTVLAVPGRIGDRLSEGCNKLIKDGAGMLLHPEDVLQELQMDYRTLSIHRTAVQLTKKEAAVLGCLSRTPADTDELLESTGMPLSDLLETLVLLEIKGQIRKSTMGGYIRVC